MYTLKSLFKMTNSVSAKINGKWYPCRPLLCCLRCRIKDAWAVLKGKADAFTWPAGQ